MFTKPRTMSKHEEIYELSCELEDVSKQLNAVSAEFDRMGVTPDSFASHGRTNRSRKKISRLLRQADTLMKRGTQLRDRLIELGVPASE